MGRALKLEGGEPAILRSSRSEFRFTTDRHAGRCKAAPFQALLSPHPPVAHKASCKSPFLCGLSPPVSPIRLLAHGYTFWEV